MTDRAAAPATTSDIRLREKISYGVGDIGSNLVYVPVSTFALFYFTDIAGIGAAAAGTILLVGQLLNGVTDLIIGYLIDKTKTRWGKARPWVLWTAIPTAASLVGMFAVPSGLNETGKVVWALTFYTLVTAVFFTASNVAYSALMSVMTPNSKTRVTLTTFRFFAALVTGLVVSVVTLPLVEIFGGDGAAWTGAIAIYALFSVVALVTVFVGTRERVVPIARDADSRNQSIRVLATSLLHNKYFFMVAGLFLAFYLTNTMAAAGALYLASDVLGDPSLFGILSAAGFLPPLLLIGFMPKIIDRFGKRRAFLVGLTTMFIGTALVLFDPTNAGLVITSSMIRGVGMVPLTAGIFALVGDVVDYGEWRFGVRTDGLIYSSVVFGQKFGYGLGGALAGGLLSLGGYNAALAVQGPSAVQAIVSISFYVPLVAIAVMAGIVWFMRIEKYAPQIQAHLNHRIQSPNDHAL